MNIHRISAVIRRHICQMFKDVARLFDLVYWPLIDIVLWGLTSIWLVQKSGGEIDLGYVLLAALIMWGVMWRSNIDISLSLLEEIWSKNIVNLFSSPLKLSEWILGVMVLGFFRAILVFCYTSLIVWFIYGFNILKMGFSILPYFFLLLASGWSVGFFVASLLIYYGQRFQAFVWAIGWLFSIIGAVFFPLAVLPYWVQVVCKIFPVAYVFEAIRSQLTTGIYLSADLWISLLLNLIYLSISLLFFNYMFNKSRQHGLALIEMD